MYVIHVSCTVNVKDESAGHVYICAFKQDLGNSANQIDKITSYIKTNRTSNQAIVRVPFDAGFTNGVTVPTTVSANIEDVIIDINDNNSNMKATVNEDYSIYALAIDKYNNVSDLLINGYRGSIPPQHPPYVIDIKNFVMNDSNIQIEGNLASTVDYDYKTATFTMAVNDEDVRTFFQTDEIRGIEILDTEIQSFDHVFTDKIYNDVSSNIDFDPFLDSTQDHYTYIYTKNKPPHDTQSNVYGDVIPAKNIPKGDITIPHSELTQLKDVSANIEFTVGNVNNTEYFVCAFSTLMTNPTKNGPLKEHLLKYGKNGLSVTERSSRYINTYYTGVDDTGLGTLMESDSTYYLYILLRDRNTGEYTRDPKLQIMQTLPLVKSFATKALDQSVEISLNTNDTDGNVDTRVVLFTQDIPLPVVSDFLQHANIDSYGYKLNNTPDVNETKITLNKAINITGINTTYDMSANVDSIIILNEALQPDIHMFTNQTYTFNMQDNFAFYISTKQNDNGVSSVYNESITFVTTDGQELNSTNGLSNIDYVSFRAPSVPTRLYYGDWNNTGMGGNIDIIHSSDVPLIETNTNEINYYAYAFVRNTSRPHDSNIGVLSFAVGTPPEVRSFDANFQRV